MTPYQTFTHDLIKKPINKTPTSPENSQAVASGRGGQAGLKVGVILQAQRFAALVGPQQQRHKERAEEPPRRAPRASEPVASRF